ncbi:MAG: short-chain fatty acid transporter [Deltaproteobacteria bacterium]|nr:short-chain fatty acid transporter [Deltaproteobacteria bacterium]
MQRLANTLSRWSERWIPDPFVIAVLLTFVTMAVVWLVQGVDPITAVGQWGGRLNGDELYPNERGFWSLLTFAMQMCLTLVTGHALASAPAVRRGIAGLVDRVRTPRGAIVATALVAMLTALLNWALGLVAGALMARAMGESARRRGIRVHYPLLGAAGYAGLLIWHGGLSGSAPLKVTTADQLASVLPKGMEVAPIPLSDTLGSGLNLAVNVGLLVLVPLLLVLMSPKPEDAKPAPELTRADDAGAADAARAHVLDRSRLLGVVVAALALGYVVMLVARTGLEQLDLNTVNLFFLGLGILLHGALIRYVEAVTDGARACAGVILQFPFYAGIMGMMALSGLVGEIAHAIGEHASATSFGPLTFLAAGLVNLFVPSGGGQFAIQGPIVIEAARELHVPLGKAVMAFCYGDQWTNMLQPFWALPLLGITQLRAGQLIGYSATLMLLVAPVFIVALLVF